MFNSLHVFHQCGQYYRVSCSFFTVTDCFSFFMLQPLYSFLIIWNSSQAKHSSGTSLDEEHEFFSILIYKSYRFIPVHSLVSPILLYLFQMIFKQNSLISCTDHISSKHWLILSSTRLILFYYLYLFVFHLLQIKLSSNFQIHILRYLDQERYRVNRLLNNFFRKYYRLCKYRGPNRLCNYRGPFRSCWTRKLMSSGGEFNYGFKRHFRNFLV